MMRRIKLFTILIPILLSCNDRSNVKNQHSEYPDKVDECFSIQSVIGKNYIDGCGCYFAIDSLDYVKGNYNLIFDYNSTGVINIGGKDFILTVNDSIKSVYPIEERRFFQSNLYDVMTEMKAISQKGDETYYYEGILTVRVKSNGIKYKINILGECGC